MQKALIVTNKSDIHADYVIDHFNKAGLSKYVVRLNTEDFLSNTNVVFDVTHFRFLVHDSSREFDISEIGSVWFRRPEDPAFPESREIELQKYINEQVHATLDGLYYLTSSAFWINPRNTMRMSNSKLHQLQVAQQVGLRVPKTLLTNSVNHACDFLDMVPDVCIKSLYSPQIMYHNETYPFFTTKLTDQEKWEHIQLVETCPTLLQEFIKKQFDLRVIAVGDVLHAVEIHSQEDDRTKEDFRVISPDKIKHKIHNLDGDVSARILEFMKSYGMAFSAFDFVVDQEGAYYFLENNPNGQWLWLEMLTDIPISESIFDLMRCHL